MTTLKERVELLVAPDSQPSESTLVPENEVPTPAQRANLPADQRPTVGAAAKPYDGVTTEMELPF